MNLFGTVGVFAETQGEAPAGTLFLNPYSNDTSLNIILAPNSQISASTSGSGNGGSIFVAAPEAIAISGQGKLAVETSGTGNAGNIRFTTGNLTLSDGVLVSASTSGSGKAGDISIQANNLTLSNGASIQTTTSSTGDSGKIEAIVDNSFILKDANTGLFANTAQESTGKGGSIFVDPILVSITNGAGISVNSLGQGNGGNIDIFTGKLIFSDRAFLLANTASGEGGNINLQIADIFFPRNNSNITATAGGTGNGGNINLSSLFTISIPSENSDIFANAFFGKGGNINITTQGIFGLAFRPRLTDFSDITASSEFGLQGNVNINTPGVDPSKGLAKLPANVSDPSRLIAQNCIADHRGSEFIITGKGGVPAKPSDRPIYTSVLDNLGTLPNHSQIANFGSPILETKVNPDAIVEATGWIVNDKNEIVLVAGVIPAQSRIRCAENK
jgi:large exoprotein involved in heme utilization and adhesion